MHAQRLAELITRVQRGCGPCTTHFLDPAAVQDALRQIAGAGLEGRSEGAARDAERCIVGMWQMGDEPDSWPIETLRIGWSPLSKRPGHRDVLGALLALGLERDRIGDIRLGETYAWVACEDVAARYIAANLTEVGHTPVRITEGGEAPPAEAGATASIQVMSLRLDSVLAAALHFSRATAQEFIRAGRVQRNWREELRVDREVVPGDMLSIRGSGRVRIGDLGGQSRKGRQYLSVETWLVP